MEASSGSCDELFNCTGQLGTFQNESWDVSMMSQAHSILRFSGSNSPFLVGPTHYESSMHILSGVNQSQLIAADNVQVTDSIKELGFELVGLYAIWVLIAYLLSAIFRKVIYSQSTIIISRLRKDKLIWEMVSGILDQFSHTPDHNSLRILWLAFLISMFMFFEYYNGLFSTELTVKVELYKIDDLEGVVASSAYPFFTNGDSGSASVFEKSEDPLLKSVFKKYKANDESEFKMYPIASAETLFAYSILIKDLKAICIGQKILATMYMYFDCSKMDEQNYVEAKEELHLATKSYHPRLFAWLFNRNTNSELRRRMSSSFRATIEAGLSEFMIDFQFPRLAMDANGLTIKAGGRSQMCLYGDKKAENHPRSMTPGDMVTLFRGFSGAMSFAIVLMMFEMFAMFVIFKHKKPVQMFTRTRKVDVRHVIRQSKGVARW